MIPPFSFIIFKLTTKIEICVCHPPPTTTTTTIIFSIIMITSMILVWHHNHCCLHFPCHLSWKMDFCSHHSSPPPGFHEWYGGRGAFILLQRAVRLHSVQKSSSSDLCVKKSSGGLLHVQISAGKTFACHKSPPDF